MKNLEKETVASVHHEETTTDTVPPTTGQQIVLTLKLIGILGLLGGLLWVIDKIRVH